MHASPSNLQQPSMRHVRWQVADASCSIWISSRKVFSAALDTSLVCSRFTITCRTPVDDYCLHTAISNSCCLAKHTLVHRDPNWRSASYSVTPGEPLALTAPNLRLSGCILKTPATAMICPVCQNLGENLSRLSVVGLLSILSVWSSRKVKR